MPAWGNSQLTSCLLTHHLLCIHCSQIDLRSTDEIEQENASLAFDNVSFCKYVRDSATKKVRCFHRLPSAVEHSAGRNRTWSTQQ